MCDLSDITSVNNVMDWIEEIFQKANYDDLSIMVLGNKCDMIERIDMKAVCKLETDIEDKYPWIIYREISVVANVELAESVHLFAEELDTFR